MTNQNVAFHLPADTGPSYWGPGDRYTFLVTGAQTNGAYFIMEAIIPAGGGPPLHIHHRESESFYLLEGTLDITLGEKKLKATTGDFVQIPRGMVHAFNNAGSTTARLEAVQDRSVAIPPVTDALIARMVGAGRKHGIEFV